MSVNDFASIQVSLASPERIHEWSHGEVKNQKLLTIVLKNQNAMDYSVNVFLGLAKTGNVIVENTKKCVTKGVVCDRCGVEITKSSVRRERMGHIELAAPVAHIWYLRGIPSRMALLLDVTPKQLEEVVYFVSWIVTDPKKQVWNTNRYCQKENIVSTWQCMVQEALLHRQEQKQL